MDKLAVLSAVERRLAAVQTVDETKAIRDQAEAIRVYAKSASKGLGIENRAAAIKILAEQRAGRLLAQVERKQGKRGKGLRVTLTQSEIPELTARRWQTMGKLSDAAVRQLEAELTEAQAELTSAEVYRRGNGGVHVQHNAGESEWYTPEALIAVGRPLTVAPPSPATPDPSGGAPVCPARRRPTVA